MGIRRVRIISRRGLEWYVEQCWAQHILVRAVVVDGYYCQADEYVITNEENLHHVEPRHWAEDLQLHRRTHPDLIMIAGGLGDAPDIGIDAPSYLAEARDAGGLKGYHGVSIHYPRTASRITAFKKYASGLPIHVTEYFVEPGALSDYLATVLKPNVRTADHFCINDGMRDEGWTQSMGLFADDWRPKPLLRQWLSLT